MCRDTTNPSITSAHASNPSHHSRSSNITLRAVIYECIFYAASPGWALNHSSTDKVEGGVLHLRPLVVSALYISFRSVNTNPTNQHRTF